MDERLVAYVREHWAALMTDASDQCVDADSTEVRELVLTALTRVAWRWRFMPDTDKASPDAYVRKALARSCRRRNKQGSHPPADLVVMDVGFVDAPVAAPVSDAQPADPASEPDGSAPIATLARRVIAARHRRYAAAGVAAVVVIAAAVSVAGSGSHHHADRGSKAIKRHRTPAVAAVAFPEPVANFAGGVAAGGGYIWTIENKRTRAGSRTYVVERQPASGVIVGRYQVPRPDDHIAYGLGKAWTWHDANDTPTTEIATVDGVGNVDTERTTPSVAVQDVTFTADNAWLTEPGANSVVTYRHGRLGSASASKLAGAAFVVPLSAFSVLVAGRSGELRALPGNEVVDSGEQTLTLLDPAPSYGFWVGHDTSLTYVPGINTGPLLTLDLPLTVASVVGDPAHGVYVATESDNPLHYDPYLIYYSPAALKASNPRPTAELDGLVQAEDMVADPAGGVVFTTNEGAVDSWRPAAPVAATGQEADAAPGTLG